MYDMSALYQAESVQDAIRLRLEHPEAQIIAGGTDVLVQMREGKRAGKALISIQKCDEMRGISIDEEENIRIGSLTSFTHITNDPIIQKYINVLGEAVDMVGGPQIRNAGTIGGNTCNGVTSADSASTLHAWEAIVELTGVNGKRDLPIKDFYIKAGTVDINVAEGEIQTAVLIPKASWENTKGFYIKYGMRNAMEIATTGCSVNVRLSGDKKTFDRVRIAYGVAGPVPMRAPSAEAVVNGQPVTMENVEAFSKAVLEDSHDPQQADLILDRACYAEMELLARDLDSRFLQRYVRLLVDVANLRTAVRVHRMGREPEFLRQVLLPGGSVSEQSIAAARADALGELFAAGSLAQAAQLGAKLAHPGAGAMTDFERACDDAVTAYLASERRVPFGEEPVVGYLYAREAEFTAVRTIFAGRAAKLEGDVIRRRLRETYV